MSFLCSHLAGAKAGPEEAGECPQGRCRISLGPGAQLGSPDSQAMRPGRRFGALRVGEGGRGWVCVAGVGWQGKGSGALSYESMVISRNKG